MEFKDDVAAVLLEMYETLIEKNKQYGNSALEPVRIFSKADTGEQLKVRIDDKLSRLARGKGNTEDTVLDLMGYLVLLRVSENRGGGNDGKQGASQHAIFQTTKV